MPAISGIDVHTYLVKDVARAIAFYRDTIGLTLESELDGQGAEFALPDGATFGLWKMEDGSWTGNSGVMFAVPDVPAAVEELKGKDVHAFHIEETPVCTMAFFEDPEGNRFVLHKRKR